jgi:hypothetical protein
MSHSLSTQSKADLSSAETDKASLVPTKGRFVSRKFAVRRQSWLDIGWLVLLAIFVAAGAMLTPFHGDEAMHIYTSEDYATAILEGHPEQLPMNPPYDIDSDPRLRLLNGSVMRYSVGLAWHLAGLTANNLPPAPGWDWGQIYDQNAATGHRPSEALLSAARTVAVIYLIGSIVVMFGIGWQFGGRWMAYFVSGLYTLNPIILLNGRRALVESAMLCFGLLTIWVALHIARRRAAGERVRWGWWLGLIIASALALASKYTSTIFVAGAFGGIFVVEVVKLFTPSPNPFPVNEEGEKNGADTMYRVPTSARERFTALAVTTGELFVSGIVAIGLLIALSPALWNNPVERARDLTQMLGEQVEIVVSILPDAPTTMGQRVEGIVTQPFMTTPQQFEQASWAEAAPITLEIQRYMSSPLSGLQFGTLLGGALTLLAGFGLIAALHPRLRPYPSWGLSVLLVVWLLVTVLNLLINPLPWQRYYLPLIPITSVLAGVALMALVKLVKDRR